MLTREKYLSKIRGFYHTESLIKIIYGMRRSGKSVILNQIMEELIKTGIKKENIIYINFESLKYDFIKNAKDLYNYIESLKVNNNKYYVFLDEIQKVEEFEKARYDAQIVALQTGKDDEAKMRHVQELYGELIQNQEASKYFDAEMKFNILIADINKIIGEAVQSLLK